MALHSQSAVKLCVYVALKQSGHPAAASTVTDGAGAEVGKAPSCTLGCITASSLPSFPWAKDITTAFFEHWKEGGRLKLSPENKVTLFILDPPEKNLITCRETGASSSLSENAVGIFWFNFKYQIKKPWTCT